MKLIKIMKHEEGCSPSKLAEGCILPGGQVAIAWDGKYKTHGTYPNWEAFEEIQSKIPGRTIEEYEADYNEELLDIHTYSFTLFRQEDVTGISGTGLVAVGCNFFDNFCVLQWVSNGLPSSIFWYPNMKVLKELHEHGGKSRIVSDFSLLKKI